MRLQRHHGWKALFLVCAILLLATSLRPGATSVGPVMEELRLGLGMSVTQVGILGALPGLVFALVGLLATSLARRCGLTGSLVIIVAAIAVGLTARAFVGHAAVFFLLTIIAFAGMGMGNVLVPPFIRQNFPFRIAAITTVYTTGLALGSTIPPLVSAPIAAATDWRVAIGLWGLTAAIALAAWIGVAFMRRGASEGVSISRGAGAVPVRALFRSKKAVALVVFFGSQSMQAYVQFAWAPQMFRDGGLSPAYAGVLLSVIAGLAIPGGLLMPTIVSRARTLTPYVLVFSGCLVVGYLGILLAPTTMPVLWAVALGISGTCFPTAIALITARTRDVNVTASLSALVQSLGYCFAALGPFVVGAVYEAVGGWAGPLWFLIGSAGVMAVSGIIAGGAGYVDDEIATNSPG